MRPLTDVIISVGMFRGDWWWVVRRIHTHCTATGLSPTCHRHGTYRTRQCLPVLCNNTTDVSSR